MISIAQLREKLFHCHPAAWQPRSAALGSAFGGAAGNHRKCTEKGGLAEERQVGSLQIQLSRGRGRRPIVIEAGARSTIYARSLFAAWQPRSAALCNSASTGACMVSPLQAHDNEDTMSAALGRSVGEYAKQWRSTLAAGAESGTTGTRRSTQRVLIICCTCMCFQKRVPASISTMTHAIDQMSIGGSFVSCFCPLQELEFFLVADAGHC